MLDVRTYESPGPVATAFLQDRSNWVRGIMGPFGSGKTNVVIFDAIACAYAMPKSLDGNRYFRGVILRDAYANLWQTTIKSWWGWFPRTVGRWTGSENRQAKHELVFDLPDGSKLYFEMIFLAIGDDRVEDVLRGIEFTWGSIGEADLASPDVLTYMVGRVLQRRYPAKRDIPEQFQNYYVGIVLDFNPPDVDNYLYEYFEVTRPIGAKLYRQPSGRSNLGENRKGVDRQAYEDIAKANAHRAWWVKRMVDGDWAPSRSGEAVYQDYDDTIHCSTEQLKPIAGIPLRLGFDQGLTGPAMLIGQWLSAIGQLRILGEFCPGRLPASPFATRCRSILMDEYRGFPVKWATSDPAGMQGSDQEHGQQSWHEILETKLGFAVGLAPTVELEPRIDGVAQLLRHRIDGRRPAIIIDPRCVMLRKGFNSKYQYPRRKIAGDEVVDRKPIKNAYSNPHDALQHLVLDLMGLDAVVSGALTGTGRASDYGDDDDAPASSTLQANFSVFGR